MEPIDRIIVSANEHPFYLPFWPVVVAAWKKFFDVEVHLAFVTCRDKQDPLVVRLEKYGNVHIYRPMQDVPEPNFSKIARYLLASRFPGDICTIADIDSVPLQRNYLVQIAGMRHPGTLLTLGGDAYKGTSEDGKWPAGWMTAEGALFGWMFSDLEPYRRVRFFDCKEALENSPDVFSDESLLRYVVKQKRIPTFHVERAFKPKEAFIDRSWWCIDEKRLAVGNYIECNFKRPGGEHWMDIKPIVEYITGRPTHREEALIEW